MVLRTRLQPDRYERRKIDLHCWLPIDGNEALLWTQGGVRGVNPKNSGYEIYKEGALKPTPYRYSSGVLREPVAGTTPASGS